MVAFGLALAISARGLRYSRILRARLIEGSFRGLGGRWTAVSKDSVDLGWFVGNHRDGTVMRSAEA